mgnify:CR=1 FL=1
MSDSCLQIFENFKYNPAFVRCNSYIIQENFHLFKLLTTDDEKFSLLEKLWKTKFNIEVIPSKDWKKLNFRSEKEKTLFLLKWQR